MMGFKEHCGLTWLEEAVFSQKEDFMYFLKKEEESNINGLFKTWKKTHL